MQEITTPLIAITTESVLLLPTPTLHLKKNNYYDNPNNDNNFSNQSKSSGFPNTTKTYQNQNIPSSTLSRSQNVPAKTNIPDKSTPQNRNQGNDAWDEWDSSFTSGNNNKPINTKPPNPITSKNTSKPVTSGWDDDNDFTDF
jgi:hypothetical protein